MAKLSKSPNGWGWCALLLIALLSGAWPPPGASQEAGRPLALAAGDLDEDGVPDLVQAYAVNDQGLLRLSRGNRAASYAQSATQPERRANAATFTQSFLAPNAVALPQAPDFIGVGDFDADGHLDVVTASRLSERLYWLRGDGQGGLQLGAPVSLPGRVSMLQVGEVNRADGLADLVVGVVGNEGARLLIFEGPNGALRQEPESLALPAPAASAALARLDDDVMIDLAVAAGERLLLIHGRDRRLSLDLERRAVVAPAIVDERILPAPMSAVVAGDFTGAGRQELAFLLTDGIVGLLADTRPPLASSAQRPPFQLNEWQGTQLARVTPPQSGERAGLLLSARISSALVDQLLTADVANHGLLVLSGTAQAETGRLALSNQSTAAGFTTLPLDHAPVAVLPMRLNGDALSDLAILSANQTAPTLLRTAPQNTFTVTNTSGGGAGSLAQAITAANANPGLDEIRFNIPGAGPFYVTGMLPVITDAVVIDGTTQPGYQGVPLVGISGCTSPPGAGLSVTAGNSVIRGLLLQGCQIETFSPIGAGIVLRDGGNNIIEGNYLGPGTRGECELSNPRGECISGNRYGIIVANSANNLIGGTTAAARNLISLNRMAGVYLLNAPDNRVQGNYIGPDPTGTRLVRSTAGIIVEANNNLIGGTSAGMGNLITAGLSVGTGINNGNGNLVQGNLYGTDPTGRLTLGNNNELNITRGANNTIGGTTAAARNVFADRLQGCIFLSDEASETLVQGNYVGVDVTGNDAIGSLGQVSIRGSSNTVGGVVAAARNVIWGGVHVSALNSANNQVQGNYIGVNANGTAALILRRPGNQISWAGVTVQGRNNRIGGSESGAGNLIAAALGNGITLGGTGNRAQGNLIGTQADGVSPLGNRDFGVSATAGNFVGGSEPGAGNVIAFNAKAGARGGVIRGNSIFANLGLGIDLLTSGVSPNIPNENHFSENHQNAPVITLAITNPGGGLTLRGSLNSRASQNFIIDFYANPTCDPSGYGEGKVYLGSTNVTTGADFNATFNATLPVSVATGQFITATATRTEGVTSEFSPCTAVTTGCLSLYPLSERFGGHFLIEHAGGAGRIGVGANGVCSWMAISGADWITIISSVSGTGDGVVNFHVAPNPTAASRMAVINIGGQQAQIVQAGRVVAVSAASYTPGNFAGREIVALFGEQLAKSTQAATALPLPTELAGATVTISSASQEFNVPLPLFFVAPSQINLLFDRLPAQIGTNAKLTVVTADGGVAFGRAEVNTSFTVGGLFSADATGQGVAAGVALRVKADGAQSYEPIARFDAAQNRFVSVPIELGPESDQVFLILFGTGIWPSRTVKAQLGGLEIDPLYVGPQDNFAGLDQVNVLLPRTLAGRGELEVSLKLTSQVSNVVRVNIR